jgi:3-phenylpropionate/trans-cinnamate dioxygenase ferredoxin reductase subunit
MADRIVIVGASHAGVGLADALRRQAHAGEIVLISGEDAHPYQRPLLSKTADYLQLPIERAGLKGRSFYSDNRVDLRLGAEVLAIMREERRLQLSSGEVLGYDSLVLAVGAEPRRLPASVVAGAPPLYLRSQADAKSLHQRLEQAQSVAVIGGGLIGLEVAGLARGMGRDVSVFEAAPSLLGRVIPARVSLDLLARHRSTGMQIMLGVRLVSIAGDGQGYAIEIEGQDTRRSDMVVVAIGSEPRTGLAQGAGLAVANGIATDGSGHTSVDPIWAVGDCADWGALDGAGFRFEGIQPATEQARIIARSILGQAAGDLPIPRYWSHQGALRLQTAGAMAPGMTFAEQAAEDGGSCVIGSLGGVARACFAVDAPNAYRDALKVLEAARLDRTAASAA